MSVESRFFFDNTLISNDIRYGGHVRVHIFCCLIDWSIYLTVLHMIGHGITKIVMLLYVSVSPKREKKKKKRDTTTI